MIANLNRSVGSTGFYLIEDINQLKQMDHDLGKALFQLHEVDKTYARLHGHPDDRYLEAVAIKIEKAQQSRDLMEEAVQDAYSQLKATIQDCLVQDEVHKMGK